MELMHSIVPYSMKTQRFPRVAFFCAGLLLLSQLPLLFAADKFGGIGATVAQLYDQETPEHLGELVVLALQEKSPAVVSGLQPGDIILEIDGVATKGKKFETLVIKHLRGPADSKVKLQIRRHSASKTLGLEVRRIAIDG